MTTLVRELARTLLHVLALGAALVFLAGAAAPYVFADADLIDLRTRLHWLTLSALGRVDLLAALVLFVGCWAAFGHRGPRPTRRLREALLVGALVAAGLGLAQVSAIPRAVRAAPALLVGDLSMSLERFLARDVLEIEEGARRLRARCVLAASGQRELEDIVLEEERRDDEHVRTTRARRARIRALPQKGRIALDLEGIDHDGVLASEALTLVFETASLVGAPSTDDSPSPRGCDAHLLREAKRRGLSPLDARQEIWRRWWSSLSAIAFAFLGASAGRAMRARHPSLMLGVGVLVVAIFGAGAEALGQGLAAAGVPAVLSLALGPTACGLLAAGLFAVKRRLSPPR